MEKKLQEILVSHHHERGELIPILQEVQAEFGYLPRERLQDIADFLGLRPSLVFGVVTFHNQFYLNRQSKHKVQVCSGITCHVCGESSVLQAVKKRLGINPGQITEDYQFTLEEVGCLGLCALGPVMIVDDKVYGRVTPGKAVELLKGMK